jgi:glycyl-tRNA synthetase beta subunit
VPALLSKLRLQHGSVEVHGTPRRLAVLVHDLASAQTPQESKVRPCHKPPVLMHVYALLGCIMTPNGCA